MLHRHALLFVSLSTSRAMPSTSVLPETDKSQGIKDAPVLPWTQSRELAPPQPGTENLDLRADLEAIAGVLFHANIGSGFEVLLLSTLAAVLV